MDHTINAPPIHIANMGGPSDRSSVTTGRTMRTPAGLGGTHSGDPRTYMVTSVRRADTVLPTTSGY